jgi:hypothetical protein
MTSRYLSRFLPALAAGLLLATTATGLCDRKYTVYRDRDGDGHFNKKTYKHDDSRHYRSSGHPGHYRSFPHYRSYSHYRPYYYEPSYYSAPSVSLHYSRSSSYSDRGSYSDDLAVEVQRELRRRGYYRGTIDGDVGPGTRSAIRHYQAARGLVVTGRIDRSLLRALDIG